MTKARLILIAAFVVTLAAGAVAGYTVRSLICRASKSPVASRPDPGASSSHSHFPDLKLTAEQKAKMDEIWGAYMRTARKYQEEQRQKFQKQREAAVIAILNDEQKVKYEEVLKNYADKIAELGRMRENTFQEAVEKTKPILNADQQKKYEEWLKNWREERHQGGATSGSKEPAPKTEGHTAAGSGASEAPGGAAPTGSRAAPAKTAEPATSGSGT